MLTLAHRCTEQLYTHMHICCTQQPHRIVHKHITRRSPKREQLDGGRLAVVSGHTHNFIAILSSPPIHCILVTVVIDLARRLQHQAAPRAAPRQGARAVRRRGECLGGDDAVRAGRAHDRRPCGVLCLRHPGGQQRPLPHGVSGRVQAAPLLFRDVLHTCSLRSILAPTKLPPARFLCFVLAPCVLYLLPLNFVCKLDHCSRGVTLGNGPG